MIPDESIIGYQSSLEAKIEGRYRYNEDEYEDFVDTPVASKHGWWMQSRRGMIFHAQYSHEDDAGRRIAMLLFIMRGKNGCRIRFIYSQRLQGHCHWFSCRGVLLSFQVERYMTACTRACRYAPKSIKRDRNFQRLGRNRARMYPLLLSFLGTRIVIGDRTCFSSSPTPIASSQTCSPGILPGGNRLPSCSMMNPSSVCVDGEDAVSL
jgi:hypothetical protein